MARKKKPETIISDNAAQFKLMKTVVDEQGRQIALHDNVVTYTFQIMAIYHCIGTLVRRACQDSETMF